MIARKAFLLLILVIGLLAGLPTAASAGVIPAAAWKFNANAEPTNFSPGAIGTSLGGPEYLLFATNIGGEATNGEITITDTLPMGLKPLSAEGDTSNQAPVGCTIVLQAVSCKTTSPIHPGLSLWVRVPVEVTLPEGSSVTNEADIVGGESEAAHVSTPTSISTSPPPFDFLPGPAGLFAAFSNADGSPAVQAGSHPYQLTIDFGLPSIKPNLILTGAEHPRNVFVDLPPGLVGNPAATHTLCTEEQLVGQNNFGTGCPDSSAVGTVSITAVSTEVRPEISPIYNMVPPPGTPAAFGTDIGGFGLFVHLIASVRSDGDYGVTSSVRDALALGAHPILGAQASIWGDPSDPAHDFSRGTCLLLATPPCSVDPQDEAFLALPGRCPGSPPIFTVRANSWETPEAEIKRSAPNSDLGGNAKAIEGCGVLGFAPGIESRPTTNLTDSTSGLDFRLHQPQDFDPEANSTATLKDVRVTLPPGLAANAAQADGLGACTSAEIGLSTAIGETPIHFSKAPAACPDASKLGIFEAASPLLAQRNEEHETSLDSEGNPIPEPLEGSVFLAKPFDNPFDSLIAVYFAIDDPKTGIVAKLAGKVEPDLQSGQLSVSVSESPELPIEDIHVSLFGGPRGSLQTPPTCSPATTEAEITPWSAPEGATVKVGDSFHPSATPQGGPCPNSQSELPNKPSFDAGTISPQAGTYSPMVLKLSREDGTQRLVGLDATAPPGLSAKLAGVAMCPESQIAAAAARGGTNEGALERANPSCPAGSEVGTVSVGAGAGPTPLYIQGHAYLAGPYKGAPLSLVVITPAIAGPFDFGVVVSRAALYLDPTTSQAHAVSDPLPRILHGIPVNLRSVALKLGRPNFTLNPTSCDPMAFAAAATSILGQIAPLSERFQAGGCKSLPYKPKMKVNLYGPTHRGGHPRLKAVFTAKAGEANTAKVSFTFPKSEFIDQGHFRTICTRVQFAANQCPAGAVYGHVRAITPLLDFPLEGPAYLRSSNHQLPDLVVALRGPPSLPIAIDAVGRVDSVNGGLRVRFEEVPDAPISKLIVTAQGAKKGLFQNSTNICKGIHKATLKLDAQSGKVSDSQPELVAQCGGDAKRKNSARQR